VDGGNTVVIIEHHMDVIKNVDHIIDLGPFGGERGGEIVAEGTPEEVAREDASATGRYLRRVLGGRRDGRGTGKMPAANAMPGSSGAAKGAKATRKRARVARKKRA
jgi:excinuclease ABC subunit A